MKCINKNCIHKSYIFQLSDCKQDWKLMSKALSHRREWEVQAK